jgi:hypothetical protein
LEVTEPSAWLRDKIEDVMQRDRTVCQYIVVCWIWNCGSMCHMTEEINEHAVSLLSELCHCKTLHVVRHIITSSGLDSTFLPYLCILLNKGKICNAFCIGMSLRNLLYYQWKLFESGKKPRMVERWWWWWWWWWWYRASFVADLNTAAVTERRGGCRLSLR